MNVTPTLNLHKPDINGEDTENVWGYDLNTNFDLIDAAFAGLAGDKGDIIVSNGSLNFDPNIVTAAARSVIAGPTITAMRTTLGAEAAIPVGTPAEFWRGDKSWQTLAIADVPALQPELDLKAPVASPVFTGNPTAPTPIPGDNDTSLATTAFVTAAMVAVGNIVPNNALPRMDGVAAPGTSPLYMRADHIHPSDTSRVAKTGDVMSGPLSGITTLTTSGIASFGSAVTVQTDSNGVGTYIKGRAADSLGMICFTTSGGGQQGQVWCDAVNGGRMRITPGNFSLGMNIDSTGVHIEGLPLTGITNLSTTGAATFGSGVTINVDPPSAGGIALVGRASDNLSLLSFRNNANTVSLGTIYTDTNAGGRLLFPTADGPWRMSIDSTAISFNSLPLTGVTNIVASGGINVAGPINFGQSLISTTLAVVLATSGDQGALYLRPNGAYATVGQFVVDPSGTASVSGPLTTTQLLIGETVNTYNGKLEIQTNNYNYGMFINNSGTVDIVAVQFGCQGTGVGAITCTSTSTAFLTSSDGDLKEDLHAFDSGSFFDRVKVYDFAWKNGAGRGVGCVAQELYEIEPNAVVPGEIRTFPATEDAPEREVAMPWGADYSKLVPHLIAEVQALRARVAHLEAA